MSTERDELALDVLWGKQFPKGATEYIRLDANAAHAIAKAVKEAGYIKSRQVTTVEELDALPVGSVIHDRHSMTWQLHDAGNDPLWHAAKHNTFRYNSAALVVRLPATVLYSPVVAP